jgi:transposase
MTYSIDFRKQVLKIRRDEKLSIAKVAKRFGVGVATVMRWTKKIDAQTKRNKPATKIDMETLKKDIEAYPDGYHYERAERLGVSKSGILYALKRLGVTYKKNPSASESRSRKTLCFLPNYPRT